MSLRCTQSVNSVLLSDRTRFLNRIAFVALLMLGVALAGVSPVSAALVGHWTLDEGSGQSVGDSASSNNGTLGLNGSAGADDPTWTSASKIGANALSLDGSNDWVNFGNVLNQGSGDFTVSFWMNASASLSTTNAGRVFQKRGTGLFGDFPGWQLVVTRSGTDNVQINNTLWEDGIAGGGDYHFISTNPSAQNSPFTIGKTNTWIQVTSVFDNTNDNWIFYADGEEVQNFNVSNAIGSVDNTRSLTLGASDVSLDQFYNGRLDDAGIFNQALSAVEVKAIYTLGDDTDPLGNGADLNLNLSDAQSLFDLHAAGTGSATVGGLKWYYYSDLTTDLGELTKAGDAYFLRLGGSGTGLSTVAPPVPEPSSLWLLGLGLLGLVRKGRGRS